jgi:hypothetical protein
MTTYRKTYKGSIAGDYVSQARVVHSGRKMNGLNRWSIQLMRSRNVIGGVESRGLTLFVTTRRLRFQVGTR